MENETPPQPVKKMNAAKAAVLSVLTAIGLGGDARHANQPLTEADLPPPPKVQPAATPASPAPTVTEVTDTAKPSPTPFAEVDAYPEIGTAPPPVPTRDNNK